MASEKRRPRFGRNAIANWIAFGFSAGVAFFVSPFIVSHLGATRYGVWSLIGGLVGYLGLLDLGIRQAVNRYTASHHAKGDHREASLIISAALRLFGVLGLVAILLSLVLAYLAPILFNIPPELAHDARVIVVLGGVTLAISLVNGVFGGVITGLERFDIHCALEVSVTVVRTAAIVLALHEGYGLVALAAIQLATSVLNSAVFWWAMKRLYAELRIEVWGALGAQMRTILSFSLSLTVLYALGRIISYSDAVVIGAFLPIESVTFYAIAGSLCMYAKELARALGYLMTPRVSALSSAGNERIGELIEGVARFSTLISAPIAFTFLIRGESFITLWMGHQYGPLSGEVLQILAVVVWLDASRSIVMFSLVGMARQKDFIPGIVVEAAANLALSLTLVHSFGIVGVALGSLIPNVLVSLWWIPHCLQKAVGVPSVHFFRRAILVPTLACIPFAAATAGMEEFMHAPNLFVFFAQVALLLPLVPAAGWFLCLSSDEKDRLKSEVSKLWRRQDEPG